MVFLVDSVDKVRFPEAKKELDVRYLLIFRAFCFISHLQSLIAASTQYFCFVSALQS